MDRGDVPTVPSRESLEEMTALYTVLERVPYVVPKVGRTHFFLSDGSLRTCCQVDPKACEG